MSFQVISTAPFAQYSVLQQLPHYVAGFLLPIRHFLSVSDPSRRILLPHFSTYQLHHLGHCDVAAHCAPLRSFVSFIQTHITSNKMAFHHTNFYGYLEKWGAEGNLESGEPVNLSSVIFAYNQYITVVGKLST
jgi:hypothetical protein